MREVAQSDWKLNACYGKLVGYCSGKGDHIVEMLDFFNSIKRSLRFHYITQAMIEHYLLICRHPYNYFSLAKVIVAQLMSKIIQKYKSSLK
jgi:hypothetical protein